MRRTINLLFSVMLLGLVSPEAWAADSAPATIQQGTQATLSEEHVYALICYSIGGSLGVLGLLLGADRIVMGLVRGQNAGAVRRYSSESVARILPLVTEGITVILVVIAVIILAVLNILNSQGAVAILSSIVGYVLGKSSRRASPTDPTDPTDPDDTPDPV